MEPKNYSTIRSILKKEQGEKIVYLDKEKIAYEIYQERKIQSNKPALTLTYDESRKKRKIEETPPLIKRPINEKLFLIVDKGLLEAIR
ncbi:hypothetical protein G9A89_018508 [Geosiphon pyriformis]|nr:hypothetical protein G9A89_018508 [Geosiphon pyriformis]